MESIQNVDPVSPVKKQTVSVQGTNLLPFISCISVTLDIYSTDSLKYFNVLVLHRLQYFP